MPPRSIDAEYLRTGYHRGDPGITFTVPPGAYRLRAPRNSIWYITSASQGNTDLLSHELTVAAGSAPTPILLTVSNQLATITGSVTVSGVPVACWIYLIAVMPTATPVLTLHSRDDGTFAQAVPPGEYQAVAFAARQTPDAQALQRTSPNAPIIKVVANEKSSVNLEATPEAEDRP